MKITAVKKEVSKFGADVIIKQARLNFVHLAKPGHNKLGKKYQYGCQILIPKDSKFIEVLRPIIGEAIEMNVKHGLKASEKKALFAAVMKLHVKGSLFKDGDKMINKKTKKPYDGCAGHYVLQTTTDAIETPEGFAVARGQLHLKNAANEVIPETKRASELYSGIWANVLLKFSVYDAAGNRGVKAYLSGVQKLKNDTRLGGFDAFEEEADFMGEEPSFDEDEL